jgi:hypothetical protein
VYATDPIERILVDHVAEVESLNLKVKAEAVEGELDQETASDVESGWVAAREFGAERSVYTYVEAETGEQPVRLHAETAREYLVPGLNVERVAGEFDGVETKAPFR